MQDLTDAGTSEPLRPLHPGVSTQGKDKQEANNEEEEKKKGSKANVDIQQKTPLNQHRDMCDQTQARLSLCSLISVRTSSEISNIDCTFLF